MDKSAMPSAREDNEDKPGIRRHSLPCCRPGKSKQVSTPRKRSQNVGRDNPPEARQPWEAAYGEGGTESKYDWEDAHHNLHICLSRKNSESTKLLSAPKETLSDGQNYVLLFFFCKNEKKKNNLGERLKVSNDVNEHNYPFVKKSTSFRKVPVQKRSQSMDEARVGWAHTHMYTHKHSYAHLCMYVHTTQPGRQRQTLEL